MDYKRIEDKKDLAKQIIMEAMPSTCIIENPDRFRGFVKRVMSSINSLTDDETRNAVKAIIALMDISCVYAGNMSYGVEINMPKTDLLERLETTDKFMIDVEVQYFMDARNWNNKFWITFSYEEPEDED